MGLISMPRLPPLAWKQMFEDRTFGVQKSVANRGCTIVSHSTRRSTQNHTPQSRIRLCTKQPRRTTTTSTTRLRKRQPLALIFVMCLASNCIPATEAWKLSRDRSSRPRDDDSGKNDNSIGVVDEEPETNGDDDTLYSAETFNNVVLESDEKEHTSPQAESESQDWYSWLMASADESSSSAPDTTTDNMASVPSKPVTRAMTTLSVCQANARQLLLQCQALLFYKPPVGFFTFVLVSRLVLRLWNIAMRSNAAAAATAALPTTPNGGHSVIEDALFDESQQKLEKLQRLRQTNYGNKKNKTRRLVSSGFKRRMTLDAEDLVYVSFGGVERVRARLCQAALSSLATDDVSSFTTTNHNDMASKISNNPMVVCSDELKTLIRATSDALQVSARPTGSLLLLYMDELLEPMARTLQAHASVTSQTIKSHIEWKGSTSTTTAPRHEIAAPRCDLTPDQVADLLTIARVTAQVRWTDALVRVCRDRILETTYRLARTVEHWEHRIKYYSRLAGNNGKDHGSRKGTQSWRSPAVWLQSYFFRYSIDDDRLRLSLARAAYNAEVKRLGEIVSLLMERPSELDEGSLIVALKATERRACPVPNKHTKEMATKCANVPKRHLGRILQKQNAPESASKTVHLKTIRRWLSPWKQQITPEPTSLRVAAAKHWLSRWNVSSFSKYSIRWKADGKGFLSVRRFDDSQAFVDGPSAMDALMGLSIHRRDGSDSGKVTDEWLSLAQEWTQNAKCTICKIVRESLQGSTRTSISPECSESDFSQLELAWCAEENTGTAVDIHEQLNAIVNYVDSITIWRRVGEGEKVRLRDAFGLRAIIQRIDFLSIPSSLALIHLAGTFHNRVVTPYWPTLRRETREVTTKSLEILEQRVWDPLKGIYDDIMNKSPGMMSALGLEVEESSLDHMLRDLGFGDGTPESRQEGLRLATEQYDQDMSSGLFVNFARGRLVRLLLVQMQQLKVGLLTAMDTIDVLIQGNRIHFKVLAAIPAVVIFTYGSRYLLRGLYNIRAKDLRPVTVVHGEMGQYLSKIETSLLLSDWETSDTNVVSTPATYLKPEELGEMILNMHRYLILLDFSSPPFPPRNCDRIHSSLQKFVGSGGTLKRLEPGRQLQWMSRIKQEHEDLAKYL